MTKRSTILYFSQAIAVTTTVLLALSGGCRGSSPSESAHARRLSYTSDWPADSLKVSISRSWPLPNKPTSSPSALSVSPSARFATLFYDRNEDGKLDRYHEPSTICKLEAGDCHLGLGRILIHRIKTDIPEALLPLMPPGERDQTYIVGDIYNPVTGAPDEQLAICRPDSDVCANSETEIYASSKPLHSIPLCNFDELNDKYLVSLKATDYENVLSVRKPPELRVRVESQTHGKNTLRLTAAVSQPVDAVMTWVGSLSNNTLSIHWSSELDDRVVYDPELSNGNARVRASIPRSQVDRCSGICVIGLDVLALTVERARYDVVEATETRSLTLVQQSRGDL